MTKTRELAGGLALVTALGLALRLYAAAKVGFGDSEALYASYALHPAPAYLDHPGLIGLLSRALGGGSAPTPVGAHRVTAFAATLAPWSITFAARGLRADWDRALAAGLVTALVPEVAVGLFAMTPDLPLFLTWTASLGLAGAGLLASPSSVRSAGSFLLAGLCAGVALSAKASALGLVAALALTYASGPARPHARTPWPWAGLALAAIVVAPIGAFEARTGWPLLRHRLVTTQVDPGPSVRNLGALVGGQLVYLSPILAIVAAALGWDLWRSRREAGPRGVLLASAMAAPLALLVPLCLWSKVAEPHWPAPALLALPLWAAVRDKGRPTVDLSRRLLRAAAAVAGALSLAVHAWVLVPSLAGLVPESAYDPKLDLSNELYGWPDAVDAVRGVAMQHGSGAPEEGTLVVVGPHWVVCAQLEAALKGALPVACAGTAPADFATWAPPASWRAADLVVFVSDNRLPVTATSLFPDRTRIDQRILEVRRAGRLARRFTIEVLALRDVG